MMPPAQSMRSGFISGTWRSLGFARAAKQQGVSDIVHWLLREAIISHRSPGS